MEIKQQNKKPVQNAGGAVPLTDILYRTLHYWKWVLLSLVVCVGAGVFYLLRTPNVYTQSASILIKEDAKGKSSAGIDDFGDFGLFSNNTNIQNEITTLKSPDLMEDVVKRLNLDMNYYLPGRFHKIVAYGSTLPVQVKMVDYPDNATASFHLVVSPEGKVTISNLKIGSGEEADKTYNVAFNDTLRTIAGAMVVSPSAYYVKGEGTDLDVVKASLSATVASFEGRLAVSMNNDKGSVIDLSFTDQNIQRADEVLGTIIGVYNENWIRDKNQIAVSTSNFINDRLNVIESELGNVDSDISSYKSANLVPDVNAAASSYMAESQQLGQEILGINNQLQMTRYIRSYLAADGNNDKALPTNTGIDNLDIQGQIGEYNAKLLERNNLVSKSSDKNPLVQNMDKELQEMRGAIIGSVDNSIINLQTQMKGLQGARGAATSKLASNPTQAKYLLSVERQQKVKESLYLFLLQKREDNELNQAFTAYNTRVIKRPGGSTAPTAPNRRNILAISFLIGLVIPFGVVYIKETNNTRVRGRKDVENLAAPMLGEIPQYGDPKKKTDNHEVVVKHGSRDVINEAFRVLRTNIEFSRVNKTGCNVMAVTSFNPGSGKSFITMNLAMSLAIKNKRVLVIDGDMRHGSTSAYVGNPEIGLSDYLSGNHNDLDSLLVNVPVNGHLSKDHRPETNNQDSKVKEQESTSYLTLNTSSLQNLQVLPIGTVPPNPTELLELNRFGQLVESMKRDYDYIIIDCPPIEVVADAQIIDQFADRTVFVLRAGLLERNMLPEFDRLYEEKKYRNIAFILNGTRNEQGRYGYSHSYKYGYGYGYGYGYNYGS